MAVPKLFTKQFKTDDATYMVFRYRDDGNNNYEYQVYKLVDASNVAGQLGAPSTKPNRKSNLNTREMWDWVWENIEAL